MVKLNCQNSNVLPFNFIRTLIENIKYLNKMILNKPRKRSTRYMIRFNVGFCKIKNTKFKSTT